jgi:hypothetical protein
MRRALGAIARGLFYVVGGIVGICVLIVAGVWVSGEVEGVSSHINIAWVHSTVHVGMTRAQVYELLKGRGLKAYWSLDPRYTLADPNGRTCAAALSNSNNRYFPALDRSRPSTCANPVVSIEYPVHANLACGTWTHQTFFFGDNDRLAGLSDGSLYTACL